MSELMKTPITESGFEHVIFSYLYCLRLMKFNTYFENFVLYLVLVLFFWLISTISTWIVFFVFTIFPGLNFAAKIENVLI